MALLARLRVVFASIALACQSQLHVVSAKSPVEPQNTTSAPVASARTLQLQLRDAMRSALGCGGNIEKDRLMAIRRVLLPMWEALPKNSLRRVGQRSVRYLAHRYFMQRFGIIVRGFEPLRSSNESHWGAISILSHQVPWYVEAVLESDHAEAHGFALSDAVYLIVALEELLFESERALLDQAYEERSGTASWPLDRAELKAVLESYLVRWLLRNDKEAIAAVAHNTTQLMAKLPHWRELAALAEGQIRALDYARQHNFGRGGGRSMLSQGYSYGEAFGMAREITESFASYSAPQCAAMEEDLVKLDNRAIGRVSLRKFYGAGLASGGAHFSESVAYLRELGALDEASWLLGTQIVIPNYMQSPSNCAVSTPHYSVCCPNRCDAIFAEVESAFRQPTASAAAIIAAVGNFTMQSSLDEEYTPSIGGKLQSLLEQIAAENGGQVTLHGRLFAQWLHYAFPRECAFPHRAGVKVWRVPSEFGEKAWASNEQIVAHSTDIMEDFAEDIYNEIPKESEESWMSQWIHEEELAVDHHVFRDDRTEARSQKEKLDRRLEDDLLVAHWEQSLWSGLLVMSGCVSALFVASRFCGLVAFEFSGHKAKSCRDDISAETRTHVV